MTAKRIIPVISPTISKTQNTIISGQLLLEYLSVNGAKFCKVVAWNAPGGSPGKKPIGKGWESKPLSLKNVLMHLASGSNVGLLCGTLSDGLCLLDADENFSKFCQTFPQLAVAPRIIRDGADRGKILIKIEGKIPQSKKWKHNSKDKSPYFEFLSTGHQGVVAGTHPTGVPYQLMNSKSDIPKLTHTQLKEICESWEAESQKSEVSPKPMTPVSLERKSYGEVVGLREQVLQYWDVLKVFVHFDRAKDVVQENDHEIRLKGNGGLIVDQNKNIWAVPGEGNVGGSTFEAWQYCKTGDSTVPKNHAFYELLIEMAKAGGILTEIAKRDRKIVIRDAKYALMPHEPIQWVVENIATKRSVNVLVGKFGSKKTWSILSLAVCVALGKSWIGIPTHQTRVLILDEESGDTRMSMRLGDTLRGLQADDFCPVYFISLGGFNLNKNSEDEALLQAYIQKTGAGLVIIDALADIMAGGDENTVKDTQPVFAALKRIAEETTAAIILLHHTNRKDEYRGSSAIPGAVDVMLNIESEESSNFIYFNSKKNRDGLPIKFSAEAHWEDNKFYLSSSLNQVRGKSYNKAQRYVLKYLLKNGASSKRDIESAADTCSPRAASDAIYALADAGKIRRTNKGASTRNGISAIYTLVEDEQDV